MNMSRKKTLIFVLSILSLFALNMYADENLSNSPADSHKSSIAVNQNGIILVVWTETPRGGDEESGVLFYNVFRDGQWQGTINTNLTKFDIWSPQLAVDSQGNFHLSYADGTSRLNRDIWHCLYNPDTGWGQKRKIYNLSPENSAWNRTSVDGNKVYVCWFHEHVDPYVSDVVMHSKVIGQQWPTSYERISWEAYDETIHPAFQVRNGRAYVTYMEGVGESSPWRLQYKEAAAGSFWEGIPHETLEGLAYYPDLDVDHLGDVHIVFSNRGGNFFSKAKENGSWQTTEVISSGFAPLQFGDIHYNNLVIMAVWVEETDIGTNAFYAKKTPRKAWGTPVALNGTGAFYPQVWIDNNGYAHIVYDDVGGVGGLRDVFYEKVSAAPQEPFLELDPQEISVTVEGFNPDPTPFTIKNVGSDPLTYYLETDEDWLSATPTSGSLSGTGGTKDEAEHYAEINALNLDQGSYTGIITVTSPEAYNSPRQVLVNLEVLAPPILAPSSFAGTIINNKTLFFWEYVHHLTWQANSNNRNIEKYRIYEIDGVNRIFLVELAASNLEYKRRHINKSKAYSYELVAVDNMNRVGEAATLSMSAPTTKVNDVTTGRVIKK